MNQYLKIDRINFSKLTLSLCWRPFLDFSQKQKARDGDDVSLRAERQE
jgi:hypothetical protein